MFKKPQKPISYQPLVLVLFMLVLSTARSNTDTTAKSNLTTAETTGNPHQVVIIKLDDLTEKNIEPFKKVAAIAKDEGISVSFGVIGKSLVDDGKKQSYYDAIKGWSNSGIEIWHHGYYHTDKDCNNNLYDGEKANFQKTVDLLKNKCDVTAHTFGAPGNHNDKTFVRVINEFADVKVFLLPFFSEGCNQLLLPKRVNLEKKVGLPDFDNFVSLYNKNANIPYMVLQGHPAMWKDDGFKEFKRVVEFLKTKNAKFMTPYGYYLTKPDIKTAVLSPP